MHDEPIMNEQHNNAKYFRISVVKPTATEQISVDMPSWNPVTGVPSSSTVASMKADIEEALTVLDDRAYAAHMRCLEAYDMLRFIPDNYRAMVLEIVDVLTGRADAKMVTDRWKAAEEETAALEVAREEAAVHAFEQRVNNGGPYEA